MWNATYLSLLPKQRWGAPNCALNCAPKYAWNVVNITLFQLGFMCIILPMDATACF
jgi:hypothetical protein